MNVKLLVCAVKTLSVSVSSARGGPQMEQLTSFSTDRPVCVEEGGGGGGGEVRVSTMLLHTAEHIQSENVRLGSMQ